MSKVQQVNSLFQAEGLTMAMVNKNILAIGDTIWSWRDKGFHKVEKIKADGWTQVEVTLENGTMLRGSIFMALLEPVTAQDLLGG